MNMWCRICIVMICAWVSEYLLKMVAQEKNPSEMDALWVNDSILWTFDLHFHVETRENWENLFSSHTTVVSCFWHYFYDDNRGEQTPGGNSEASWDSLETLFGKTKSALIGPPEAVLWSPNYSECDQSKGSCHVWSSVDRQTPHDFIHMEFSIHKCFRNWIPVENEGSPVLFFCSFPGHFLWCSSSEGGIRISTRQLHLVLPTLHPVLFWFWLIQSASKLQY